MNKKLIALMLTLVCLVVAFAGCSGSIKVDGGDITIESADNSGTIKGQYSEANGEQIFNIKIDPGKRVEFSLFDTTSSGSLEVYVIGKNGDIKVATTEPIFGDTNNKFDTGIYQSGTHENKIKVKLVAKNHKGGFHLDYLCKDRVNIDTNK